MTYTNAVHIEIIRAVVGLILLLATWGIGQQVIAHWDLRKKRRELDIGLEGEFQSLYGEFKQVARLWRIVKSDKFPSSEIPQETRWNLLSRAAVAESRVEVVLMKIASERALSTEDRTSLGLFRQAYQQLREAIRDDVKIPQSFSDTEYHYFNLLTIKVARILRTAPLADSSFSDEYRFQSLSAIVRVRGPDYALAVSQYRGLVTSGDSAGGKR